MLTMLLPPAGATRPAQGDRAPAARPVLPRPPARRARVQLAPGAWPAIFATLPCNERGEVDCTPEAAARWTPEQLAAFCAEDDARQVIEAAPFLEPARRTSRTRDVRRSCGGHFLDELDQNYWTPDGDDVDDCGEAERGRAGGARLASTSSRTATPAA